MITLKLSRADAICLGLSLKLITDTLTAQINEGELPKETLDRLIVLRISTLNVMKKLKKTSGIKSKVKK